MALVNGEVAAQSTEQLSRSPVLVIDFEELFRTSETGRGIQRSLEARSRDLAEESARIDAEMTAEEQSLTEQRDSLSPAEFRALADAFDEKVQRLRREQDQKAQDLARFQQEEQLRFRQQALPVLGQLMLNAGATIVVEKRNVLIFNDAVNVTEITAIALDERTAADREEPAAPESPAPNNP